MAFYNISTIMNDNKNDVTVLEGVWYANSWYIAFDY
jgi:hypothetical protein